MIKSKEITDLNSCLNKSRDDEPLFVICGRDITAPVVIEKWIKERIKSGKNKATDEQILEAHDAIRAMETYRAARHLL